MTLELLGKCKDCGIILWWDAHLDIILPEEVSYLKNGVRKCCVHSPDLDTKELENEDA